MSSEEDPKFTTRRKPVKGYYVPSRYKQAAEASGQSSSSKEISPRDTTRIRGCSTQSQQSKGQSTLRSTSVGSSRYLNAKKYSSTPAIQGRHVLPAIETSAITDASGFLCLPKDNSKTVLTSVGNEQTFQTNKTRSNPSKSAGQFKTKESTLSSAEINILYAEYLQAKLLESNSLEATQKRSEHASEKIHQIWCLMQKLMIKNAKIHQELSFVSHLIRLHKHLHKQEKMLLPVLDIIPNLESQYESIANAVNIVRHKLEVKNMSLPPDTESEEEIIQLLLKISDLIQSLKNVQDSEKVIATAGVSDMFLQQGKVVADEIKRSENLLFEVNDLLLDETSLKLASTNQL